MCTSYKIQEVNEIFKNKKVGYYLIFLKIKCQTSNFYGIRVYGQKNRFNCEVQILKETKKKYIKMNLITKPKNYINSSPPLILLLFFKILYYITVISFILMFFRIKESYFILS